MFACVYFSIKKKNIINPKIGIKIPTSTEIKNILIGIGEIGFDELLAKSMIFIEGLTTALFIAASSFFWSKSKNNASLISNSLLIDRKIFSFSGIFL